MTRRAYLRGATALGVAGVATGLAAPASASTSYDSRFSTVIDVVEAGADNTGTESITDVLRNNADDDTLLSFPSGTYYMDEQFRFSGFSNFGMVGSDATLLPAPIGDFQGPTYRLFRLGVTYAPGTDLLIDGFTVDQTADNTGIRVVEAMITDGLEVRNVTVNGKHDSGTWGPGFFSVTDPKGSGVVEAFEAPDGGAWVSDTPNPIGLWRGPTGILLSRYHEGTITLRDCVLGGFPDNGLYGVTNGTVRVVGGTYENSHVASVRLAGQDCLVRDATVRVTENPTHFTNQRGIRLEGGAGFTIDNVSVDLQQPNGHGISIKNDVSSARLESSKVTVADVPNHGIVLSPGCGDVDIVGTDVEIDGSGNAIQINGTDAGKVVCEKVQVWGQASGRTWRHAIRCNRNNCEFRGVEIWQPGPHLRRALVLNGDDCLVYNVLFRSRHHPIVVNGAGEWVQGSTLECYDDYAAIRLNDSSADVTIKDNALKDGVLNKGCARLRMYGNTE